MNARQVLDGFEKTYGQWRAVLEQGDEERFGRTPATGGWSLGQICDHVANASNAFLDAAEALTRGEGEEHGGSLFGFIIFGVINGFPPFRFKVPPNLPKEYERLATPDSIAKAEALERFEAVAGRTRSLRDAIAAASGKLRIKHPDAGWFNALQWYQLSEMHMRHHLRQLRRVEKEPGAA